MAGGSLSSSSSFGGAQEPHPDEPGRARKVAHRCQSEHPPCKSPPTTRQHGREGWPASLQGRRKVDEEAEVKWYSNLRRLTTTGSTPNMSRPVVCCSPHPPPPAPITPFPRPHQKSKPTWRAHLIPAGTDCCLTVCPSVLVVPQLHT